MDDAREQRITEFFDRYEQGANTFDADLTTSEYAETFMTADTNGVMVMQNDDAFRAAIPERKRFFETIGFRKAEILRRDITTLDDRYAMVKVRWHMRFQKEPGDPMDAEFDITYVLFEDRDLQPKVVFSISHEDEEATMRQLGLSV